MIFEVADDQIEHLTDTDLKTLVGHLGEIRMLFVAEVLIILSESTYLE